MRVNFHIDQGMPGMSEYIGGLQTEQRAYMLRVFAEIGFMVWNGGADPNNSLPVLEDYFARWSSKQTSIGVSAVIEDGREAPSGDTNTLKAEDTAGENGTYIVDDDSCTIEGFDLDVISTGFVDAA